MLAKRKKADRIRRDRDLVSGHFCESLFQLLCDGLELLLLCHQLVLQPVNLTFKKSMSQDT
jgi:hypothetical protein